MDQIKRHTRFLYALDGRESHNWVNLKGCKKLIRCWYWNWISLKCLRSIRDWIFFCRPEFCFKLKQINRSKDAWINPPFTVFGKYLDFNWFCNQFGTCYIISSAILHNNSVNMSHLRLISTLVTRTPFNCYYFQMEHFSNEFFFQIFNMHYTMGCWLVWCSSFRCKMIQPVAMIFMAFTKPMLWNWAIVHFIPVLL